MTGLKNTLWRRYVQPDTWVIVCDMDEWLVADVHDLQEEDALGTTILLTDGWQMVGDSQKADLSDISPDTVTKGFRETSYSKQICFKWDAVAPNWGYGCHEARPTGRVVCSQRTYLLKHMSTLGGEFTTARDASRYPRMKGNREKYGWAGQYLADREMVLQRHASYLAKAVELPETCVPE